MSETTDQRLRQTLADVLGLPLAQVAGFTANTGLFGHLPELDSMAVATLLTELEDRFGLELADADIDGDLLASYGSLSAFVAERAA